MRYSPGKPLTDSTLSSEAPGRSVDAAEPLTNATRPRTNRPIGSKTPIGRRKKGKSKRSSGANNKRKWTHPDELLRLGIWVYLLLVIFEGALRKWFLPFAATPLLVVRDPIALGVVYLAYRRGKLPLNWFVISFVIIGGLGMATAMGMGHGSLFVAAFGARTMIVHVPMAFVIGRVLSRDDLLRMGRSLVWIVPPMTLLVALQFYSPQSAWVNRGVGGDTEGAGFSGAMGFSRPPGTFSFTNGLTSFYGLAGVWIAYFWLKRGSLHRTVLWMATACLILAIPMSISRSLVFQTCITLLFAVLAIGRKPQYIGKLIVGTVGVVISIVIISTLPAFQTATEVMATRFENASKSEGGIESTLIDRFLGGLVGALFSAEDVPFFGVGIGLGTNVGAKYTTGGRGFLVAEGEWGRTIGELGAVMGLTVVTLRLSMAGLFAIKSYRKLTRNDPLPWMILAVGLLATAVGGWAQPTDLGFYTVTVGLLLAALRTGTTRSTSEGDRTAKVNTNNAADLESNESRSA